MKSHGRKYNIKATELIEIRGNIRVLSLTQAIFFFSILFMNYDVSERKQKNFEFPVVMRKSWRKRDCLTENILFRKDMINVFKYLKIYYTEELIQHMWLKKDKKIGSSMKMQKNVFQIIKKFTNAMQYGEPCKTQHYLPLEVLHQKIDGYFLSFL